MLKRISLMYTLLLSIGMAHGEQLLDRVVAVVNNSVITASELNAHVAASKQQILAQGQQLPAEKELKKQVLQHLINQDLQLQMAKQNNITVEDKELDEAIAQIATTNHIELSALKDAIVKEGMSWDTYRNNIRKEMLIGRLQQKAVGKDVLVTNEQVEQFLKAAPVIDTSKVSYHLQNLVVPVADDATLAQVDKARTFATKLMKKINKDSDFERLAVAESSPDYILETNDLGERHLAELPELYAAAVVKMSPGQVSGPIRAGNGYQIIKLVSIDGNELHHVVTQTHVRHILLKPDSSMLPEEAKKQVRNIYQQITSGKDFATMAKQYSLDIASAVKGGDLGWVSPGELVPEFEKEMNSLPLHRLSKPVKSKFGWHLIEVLERRQKDDSIAFRKQQAQQLLQQRKFSELVQNWQQHIRAEAYIKIMDKDLA